MSFLINNGIPESDLPVKSPSGSARVRYVDGDGKSYSSAMPDVIAASALVQDAIDGVVANAESEAKVILEGLGYLPPVAFASGLNVDSSRFTVTYAGVTYAPIADAIPFTTSSTFNPAQWRVVQGDINLRSDLADPTGGAGLVAFRQPGTGTVLRTSHDKLRETVSVLDFGAVADSISYNNVGTDSSSAFQAAINHAMSVGADVYVPAGKYYAKWLTWGVPSNLPNESGGINNKGPRLIGDSVQSSIIYTNGFDFMDVRTAQKFAARNITIMSNTNTAVPAAPSGRGIWSSATTAETGLARPRVVIVDLKNVELSRFDIAIDSDGFWTSKIDNVKAYFNRIGLNLARVYNVSITCCDFLCRTVMAIPDEPTAFAYEDNHHSVGTWESIFGTAETTLDIRLGQASLRNNYFENYAGSDLTGASTLWRFSVGGTDAFDVSNNFINTGGAPIKLRNLRRSDGVDSQLRVPGEFKRNRIVAANKDTYWADSVGPSTRLYINDDEVCGLVGSKVVPENQQRISVTKLNESYVKGTAEPVPNIANFTGFKVVGDVNMTPESGALALKQGMYRLTVTARGWQSVGSLKKMFLRFTASGVHYDFLVVDDSSSQAKFNSNSMVIRAGFDLTMVPSYHFPVAAAAGDTFTLSEVTVCVEPVAVFNATRFTKAP